MNRPRIHPRPERTPIAPTTPNGAEALRHATVTPPAGAWWNGIARKWFTGDAANPTALDPQPPPPMTTQEAVPPAARMRL